MADLREALVWALDTLHNMGYSEQSVNPMYREAVALAAEPAESLDALMAGAKERVQAEHAARYVDLWATVEIADRRVEQDFDSKTVVLNVTDWNRIVAVARGHMSQKARQAIERFHDNALSQALRPEQDKSDE